MGASFDSILIRTENSDLVQKALEQVAKGSNCKFLLGPEINGWISVFPSDFLNDVICAKIAGLVPDDIFHLAVHDDDIFIYYFYRDGRLVDQYNSNPNYPDEDSEEEKQECQGRPELFQDLLRQPKSLAKLKTLLAADTERERFIFESERMAQFVKLLGLTNALASYDYLQARDQGRDEIRGWKQFIHIPDLSAEKNAKRAAQALIKAEKKRLHKEGILFAEIKPPKRKGPGLPISITWGTDSTTNGLLLAWHSYPFIKSVDDEHSAAGLFTIQPPWNSPPPLLGSKNNFSAYHICMSPSAKWLAGGFGAGDWAMRVWDWQRKELAFEVIHTSAVSWVAFSQDEHLVYSLSDEFIVTSMTEKRPVVTIKGVAGGRAAAVHPSGKFVAVALQDRLAIIDLEDKQLIKALWVNRRVKTLDPFARDSQGMLIRTCLKTFLENPKIRQKLGVDAELHAAILQDPNAVEKLNVDAQQKIKSMVEKVRSRSLMSFETKEHVFDVQFSPTGEQLFIASNGMRVFDWNKLLLANEDAPAPELSVDAPGDDEEDPNSRPLAYCVRFDPERNLLLSSCLAGVIQFLNIKNGQSGTLLKMPEPVTAWQLELTGDRKALCCYCADQPPKNYYKGHRLQIWNYPALCKAAGLE